MKQKLREIHGKSMQYVACNVGTCCNPALFHHVSPCFTCLHPRLVLVVPTVPVPIWNLLLTALVFWDVAEAAVVLCATGVITVSFARTPFPIGLPCTAMLRPILFQRPAPIFPANIWLKCSCLSLPLAFSFHLGRSLEKQASAPLFVAVVIVCFALSSWCLSPELANTIETNMAATGNYVFCKIRFASHCPFSRLWVPEFCLSCHSGCHFPSSFADQRQPAEQPNPNTQ